MEPPDIVTFRVAPADAGLRLDVYIARHMDDCTRSYAASLIRQGEIQVDGAVAKPSHKTKNLEQITVQIPKSVPLDVIPEPMDLDILFEDRYLIAINKPPGLVVHPAAGHAAGTLVNGILHHCPDLEGIAGQLRPGIVHRLDKDTSGAIVVAKTASAMAGLSQQFKARKVQKQYLALVYGIVRGNSGTIDLPVGRHPVDRKKMSTISPRGRAALTLWRVKQRYQTASLLEIQLRTGRTHQIRVHCKSMGHPIVGDAIYGSRKRLTPRTQYDKSPMSALTHAKRQMLHACQLGIVHPVSAKSLLFEAPLPDDMISVIEALENNCKK
jgi:23S rRNA pseudouridine1911/1915/1917 synthase